jgi:hypothetical protein
MDDEDTYCIPKLSYYVLHARRGGKTADYALIPCHDGWYTHFLEGAPEMQDYNRYVGHETIDNLKGWWYREFDIYSLKDMPADMKDNLRRVALWQNGA